MVGAQAAWLQRQCTDPNAKLTSSLCGCDDAYHSKCLPWATQACFLLPWKEHSRAFCLVFGPRSSTFVKDIKSESKTRLQKDSYCKGMAPNSDPNCRGGWCHSRKAQPPSAKQVGKGNVKGEVGKALECLPVYVFRVRAQVLTIDLSPKVYRWDFHFTVSSPGQAGHTAGQWEEQAPGAKSMP